MKNGLSFKTLFSSYAFMLFCIVTPVKAEEVVTEVNTSVVKTTPEQSIAPEVAKIIAIEPAAGEAGAKDNKEKPAVQDKTYEQRLRLAKQMHKIKPMRETMERVLDDIAQSVEPGSREIFKSTLMQHLDVDVVEAASVEAMVETFTAPELRKMVDYSGSKEGRRISEKMPVYQTLIQPAITQALDKAMVNLRFGGPQQ